MPGMRSRVERTDQVIVRCSPEDKERWRAYCDKGVLYLSELVRLAVERFIREHPDPRKVSRYS